MDLDPGGGVVHRRAADILQADGAGADEHDLAVQLVRRHLILEHGARRYEALLAMTAVVERQPAACVGAGFDVAGPDGDDPGLGAERNFAARAGRFDDVGAGALGNPQRLDRQGREQAFLAGDTEKHRNPADHRTFDVGIHAAVALGGGLENGERLHGALLHRQELARIVAGEGGAEHALGRLRATVRIEAESQDHARVRDGVGQHLVVVLDRRRELLHGLGIGIGDEVLDHAADRRAVGLGEHHVEGDGGGALLGQLVDQTRDDGTRPRPLAELGQGGLVYVDDADRRGGMVGPRLEALEVVEGDVAQAGQS